MIKLNLISFFIAYYLFVGTGWTRVASSVLSLLPVTLQDPFNFSFFVAPFLTVSLQGPVLAHYDEADRPSLMGRVGQVVRVL